MIKAAKTKDLNGRATEILSLTASVGTWDKITRYLEEAGFGEWPAKPENEAAFTAFWTELKEARSE